jgi:uncharacterized membrane protein YkvA (DUF1232 family)
VLDNLKARAEQLKRETSALAVALSDPRTPWQARLVIWLTVAYALSPLDLIPDWIPVLGYVDDLLIVPLGIALSIRLIPPDVLAEAHARALDPAVKEKLRARGLAAVVALWVVAALAIIALVWRMTRR